MIKTPEKSSNQAIMVRWPESRAALEELHIGGNFFETLGKVMLDFFAGLELDHMMGKAFGLCRCDF